MDLKRVSRLLTPKSTTLLTLLNPSSPVIAISSHSPLSAKLASRAGFKAIWISGFELSATHAVPDANILSHDKILELTRSINETVQIPTIVDMDTGFGNAVNISYLIKKFENAGAAGVVIEDKTFPKDSSLRKGGRQKLVEVEEFEGKIRAAREESSLVVIARTEALIAGFGEDEALRRAYAYVDAGAHAVLVHSKQKTPEEVVSFCQVWDGRVPLVLVPTSYPQLSFGEIAKLGKVGMVICGNHAVRAAISGMKRVFERILESGGIEGVEGEIVGVDEVFEIMGDERMREVERRFLR